METDSKADTQTEIHKDRHINTSENRYTQTERGGGEREREREREREGGGGERQDKFFFSEVSE